MLLCTYERTVIVMLEKKRDYIYRAKKLRVLSLLRNICFGIGITIMLPLILLADTEGKLFTLFIIGLLVSSLMMLTTAVIEFYALYFVIHKGDLKFNTIFTWNYYAPDNTYATWLKENDLQNSRKNFLQYIKEL